ncbi:MAG TPA: diguanylate cyclase [Bacteroidales bacterium]|nr:MAG: hypothetical protein A2W98_09445 [Bacteroidetes bacterium GWF2_33_38]OFY87625.1 MAG: hypothetical protein A2236_10530 [Bacteroidetes bacterium RIFOXYA2_FULL_33_7]HBF87841.1 diguanylate cyclase [Bacteroidales bacterium]
MENWSKELNIAITVADANGIIQDMNQKSMMTFQKSGSESLIGKSLYDCHPQKANEKINELMAEQKTNAYTIEKNGIKKLIYQTPWFENGKFKGLVELSLEIPFEMKHFVRNP